jgi:4-hydroxy-tetrahydrodipicolinate synthase
MITVFRVGTSLLVMGKDRFLGVIPAVVTPMRDEYTVDVEAFDDYIQWLMDQGAVGLAVNVDTGEGPTLTGEEKVELLGVARERVGDGVLVAGVMGPSTRDVKAEAGRAAEAGADVALVFPNTAFRGEPLNHVALREYYREIGGESGLDLMLFLLQDALGGIELDGASLRSLASLDGMVAVKEATFGLSKFKETMELFRSLEEEHDKEIAFLTGNDNFIFESFLWGCDGALIGAAAQDTERIVGCYEASRKGNWGRAIELAQGLQPLVDAVFAPPVRDYRAKLKACLYLQGVIPSKAVRPPLVEVLDEGLPYWRGILQTSGLQVER